MRFRASTALAAICLGMLPTLASAQSMLAPRVLGTGPGTVAAGNDTRIAGATAAVAAEAARAAAAEGALVTPAQMAAALSGIADGTTLTYAGGKLSVIGQAPTPAASVPAAPLFLLGDGTTLTLAQLQGLLGTVTSGGTTPAAATAYTIGLASASVTVGTAVAVTLTPTGGAWPSGEVLTLAVSGISGTFNPATLSPSGSGAVTAQFTASAAGSGTISATSSPAMTDPSGVALTVAAAVNSTIITFAGPAGAPTGNQVLTSALNGSLAGYGLDGNGNLLLPGGAFNFGLFEAIGSQPDAPITATFAAAPDSVAMLFRATPATNTYYALFYYHGEYKLFGTVNGASAIQVGSAISAPGPATNLQIVPNGSTFVIKADGATVSTFTDSTIPVGGFVGIGSANSTSRGAAILSQFRVN